MWVNVISCFHPCALVLVLLQQSFPQSPNQPHWRCFPFLSLKEVRLKQLSGWRWKSAALKLYTFMSIKVCHCWVNAVNSPCNSWPGAQQKQPLLNFLYSERKFTYQLSLFLFSFLNRQEQRCVSASYCYLNDKLLINNSALAIVALEKVHFAPYWLMILGVR